MTIQAAITPSLFLGPIGDCVWHDDMEPALSPGEAVAAINSGHKALLVNGDWQDAFMTLRMLGMSSETVNEAIHFARTGRLS